MSTTIEETLTRIPSQRSPEIATEVRDRWDSLTKPRGSLGILEDEIVKLCEIQGATMPRADRRCIYVFCGDHGITEEGVSPYPSVVTREMVKNFVTGGAAINVLCRHSGIETRIVDAGVSGEKLAGTLDCRVAAGTANFLSEPAMTRAQVRSCLETGIGLAEEGAKCFDLVGIGEMGIGNSTSASALLSALTGAPISDCVGRGAGLDDAGLQHKCNVIQRALETREFRRDDPISVVAVVGGFEIAMMAGFLLGGAACRLPVVVDGFISGAAALVAHALYPAIAQHLFFAHQSAERGHALLLNSMQANPLLQLRMRLGEGTGAALAMDLLTSAAHLYQEMATFAEASVSDLD